MSNLANASSLLHTPQPLPANWYTDPGIYEIEQKILFENAPGYVGHELMAPEVGNYHSLEWMNHGKALVRTENGVELLSNICCHRQAIMLKGRGQAQNIVCPLHRWTYNLEGKLPAHGAIWLVYYPKMMIEWHPHSLIISHIAPSGPLTCTNVVEFYHPEDIALFEREFIEAEQATHKKTAVEDEEICQCMDDGRRELYRLGLNEAGP
ncbi:MAG: Rieske 2Fe-2S domain-containing protein [Sulfuricellaceae bacterium]|nr:Rieske 2Fe-2S domain-containing protein [Sulfuricellaceae bacterium]